MGFQGLGVLGFGAYLVEFRGLGSGGYRASQCWCVFASAGDRDIQGPMCKGLLTTDMRYRYVLARGR